MDGEIFTVGAKRGVYELVDYITIVGVKTLPSGGDVRQYGVVKRHEYGPRAVERMVDEDQLITPVDNIIPTAGSKEVWFHQTFCCVAVRKISEKRDGPLGRHVGASSAGHLEFFYCRVMSGS